MIGDPTIVKLMKRLAGSAQEEAGSPVASSTDLDDIGMEDDPRAQFTLALKRKRRTMMMKKMLEQGGMGDLARIVSIREK